MAPFWFQLNILWLHLLHSKIPNSTQTEHKLHKIVSMKEIHFSLQGNLLWNQRQISFPNERIRQICRQKLFFNELLSHRRGLPCLVIIQTNSMKPLESVSNHTRIACIFINTVLEVIHRHLQMTTHKTEYALFYRSMALDVFFMWRLHIIADRSDKEVVVVYYSQTSSSLFYSIHFH